MYHLLPGGPSSSNLAEYQVPAKVLSRGTDPTQAVALNAKEAPVEAPVRHIAHPRIYKTAFATVHELKALNGGWNWKKALFEGGPGYYFAKCPQAPHVAERIEFVDVVFTLPSEYLSHREVYDKYHDKGKIALSVTKGQLFEHIGDMVDVKRKDFHIVPKQIEVIDIHSSFPISFDLTLKSRLNNNSYQSWSTPRGVVNVVDAGANKFSHLFVPSDFRGELPDARRSIYVASDYHNDPAFSEYINIDFETLVKQLSALKTHNDAMPVYKLITPLPDETNFSLPFWFILTEWHNIRLKTAKEGFNDPRFSLNKVIPDSQHPYILVSQKVLNEVIADRMAEHARPKHLMNLTDVVVELTPLLGRKGWENYDSIINLRRKELPDSSEQKYARFQVVVRIAFEKYSGAIPEADVASIAPLQGVSNGLVGSIDGVNLSDRWS